MEHRLRCFLKKVIILRSHMEKTVHFIFTFDSFDQKLQWESRLLTGLHITGGGLVSAARTWSLLLSWWSVALGACGLQQGRLHTNRRILHTCSSKCLAPKKVILLQSLLLELIQINMTGAQKKGFVEYSPSQILYNS